MKPTFYALIQLALLMAVVLLADTDRLMKIVLPIPAMMFIVWWLLSYLWATDRPGWSKVVPKDLVTVLSVLILAQILPLERFVKTLLRTGLVAFGLMVVTFVLHPGSAFVTDGAVPGLRGGFIHKNFMAPTFIFMAIVVLCYVQTKWIRQTVVIGTFVMMFLGKTTTGIVTFAMVLLLEAVLRRWTVLLKQFGRAFGIAVVGALLVATLAANSLVGYFLTLNGKDFTFSSRTLIWKGVVHAIAQRPITGWGWGAWANLYQEPAYSINKPLGFQVAVSHSAPLELLLRLGVIGLFLFLVQFTATMRGGFALIRANDPLGRLILLFGAMLIIFGFSEAHVAVGGWFGLLCLLGALRRSRQRPTPAISVARARR